VVRPGKAEADTTEPIPTFFEHVDALRADQVQLNCKLTKERVANCQARSDLAAAQHAYERACHLTHKTMKDIAEYRLQLSKTQLEVAEAQKALREEEAYIGRLQQRISELQKLNQETANNLRTHTKRVAQFHDRLSTFVSCVPVARESEAMIDELARLKSENQKLKLMTARFDVKLIEEAKAAEEERHRLELAIVEAKARLLSLQNRLSETDHAESGHLQQLKTALEVQLATNDAIEAEIQAKERQLLGAGANDVGDWPEL
jgi:chromosome segregation ATPase